MRTTQRRSLLKSALAAGVSLCGSRLGGTPPPDKALPSVPLGKIRLSRLIAGANPINGYGHSTRRMDELMVNYFGHAGR